MIKPPDCVLDSQAADWFSGNRRGIPFCERIPPQRQQHPPQMLFRIVQSDWNQLLQHIVHSLLPLLWDKTIIADARFVFNAKILETEDTNSGSCCCRKQYHVSDKEPVEQIWDNLYCQYFMDLPGYEDQIPFLHQSSETAQIRRAWNCGRNGFLLTQTCWLMW